MNKNIKMSSLALVATLFLSLAIPVQAETLKVTSGATVTESILGPIKDAFAKSSGITLNISTSTPAQGWQQATAGQVDAAIYGLSFSEIIASVEEEGGTTANRREMYPQMVGMMDAGTKIITSRDVGLSVLNTDQLRSIFAGEITNWSAVGGPNLPITVVVGSKIPGSMAQFKKAIMEDKEYSANALKGERYPEIKAKILVTPGSIGFSSAALLDDSIQPIRYSGGMRIVTLITKGVPSPAVSKLISFIQKEGKEYIKQ
ncbi:MAG: hypothetical protein GX087_08340 [Desulfobulbaceae bacterium]|nr:hypothetical protein [Desulfobulbaceae bacterium]